MKKYFNPKFIMGSIALIAVMLASSMLVGNSSALQGDILLALDTPNVQIQKNDSTNILVNGNITLLDFNILNNTDSDIKISKLTFDVSTSDVSIDEYRLTSSGGKTILSNAQPVFDLFDLNTFNYNAIIKGEFKKYALQATVHADYLDRADITTKLTEVKVKEPNSNIAVAGLPIEHIFSDSAYDNGNACPPSQTMYLGECVEASQPCKNPPKYSIESTCFDWIENGERTELYNFECQTGFQRSHLRCTRPSSYKTNVITHDVQKDTATFQLEKMINLYYDEYYVVECYPQKGGSRETGGPPTSFGYSTDTTVVVKGLMPNMEYKCNPGSGRLWPNGYLQSQSAIGKTIEFITGNFSVVTTPTDTADRLIIDNHASAKGAEGKPSISLWFSGVILNADENYYAACDETNTNVDNHTSSTTKNSPVVLNNLASDTMYSCAISIKKSDGTYRAESERVNILTPFLPTSSTQELSFTVQITSNPPATNPGTDSGRIDASIGDIVTFTRHITQSGVVNSGWQWNWDKTKLNCSAYPEFDSPNLRCEVVTTGTSSVSITMYPVMTDGTKRVIGSNLITVMVKDQKASTAKSPAPVVNPASPSAEPNASGYEDKIVTVPREERNPFSDIDMSTLAGQAAAHLNSLGVIGGYPDGEFKGTRKVNRAEAAKFLLLASETPVRDIPNNGRFWDVKDGEWYTKYVMTAAEKGIINGYPDGSFSPADVVNTAEFLKMMTLTFDLSENLPVYHRDVPRDAWYYKYAGIAEEYLLFPNRVNNLIPDKELTREEVAIAIYRYLNQN